MSGDDDRGMKRYLTRQFSECEALMKLIEATPPHQIHRRRIEVKLDYCSVVLLILVVSTFFISVNTAVMA